MNIEIIKKIVEKNKPYLEQKIEEFNNNCLMNIGDKLISIVKELVMLVNNYIQSAPQIEKKKLIEEITEEFNNIVKLDCIRETYQGYAGDYIINQQILEEILNCKFKIPITM